MLEGAKEGKLRLSLVMKLAMFVGRLGITPETAGRIKVSTLTFRKGG